MVKKITVVVASGGRGLAEKGYKGIFWGIENVLSISC